jgi:hypothetical protein
MVFKKNKGNIWKTHYMSWEETVRTNWLETSVGSKLPEYFECAQKLLLLSTRLQVC